MLILLIICLISSVSSKLRGLLKVKGFGRIKKMNSYRWFWTQNPKLLTIFAPNTYRVYDQKGIWINDCFIKHTKSLHYWEYLSHYTLKSALINFCIWALNIHIPFTTYRPSIMSPNICNLYPLLTYRKGKSKIHCFMVNLKERWYLTQENYWYLLLYCF